LANYRFGANEIKNKHHRRVVVPRRLAKRLEEYLSESRPLLVSGKDDQKTLFLNREGRRLTQCQFTDLVAKLSRDFTGKRSTPHIIRDIFADWWLRHHPADYLTLSKMLGHTNLQTTINSYAYKFDESAALCRVEDYREQHVKQSGSSAQAPVPTPSTKKAMVLVKAPTNEGYLFGPAAKAA
jgi:integrase